MSIDSTETIPSSSNPKMPDTQVLNRGGWANGDVYLTRIDDQPAVVKTYADKPALIRLLGRYLIRREQRAYRTLAGISGVPALLESGDPEALALEFVPGDRISNHLLKLHGPQIVSSLTRLIEAMHERGVYHMDLRNQGNVLVGKSLEPTVLDFASAVIVKRRNPVSGLVAALCRRFDLYGLSKWRNRSLDLELTVER